MKLNNGRVYGFTRGGHRALRFLGLGDKHSSSSGLKVDMVITDYCMPEMIDYELLKKIKGTTCSGQYDILLHLIETMVNDAGKNYGADIRRMRPFVAQVTDCLDNELFKNTEMLASIRRVDFEVGVFYSVRFVSTLELLLHCFRFYECQWFG